MIMTLETKRRTLVSAGLPLPLGRLGTLGASNPHSGRIHLLTKLLTPVQSSLNLQELARQEAMSLDLSPEAPAHAFLAPPKSGLGPAAFAPPGVRFATFTDYPSADNLLVDMASAAQRIPTPQHLPTHQQAHHAPAAVHTPWWLRAARRLPSSNLKIATFCALWYLCLAVSNNSTKAILRRYPHPVAVTEIQFLLNAMLSVAVVSLVHLAPTTASAFPKGTLPPLVVDRSLASSWTLLVAQFVTPTQLVVATTLPMGVFQFVGHITLHQATLMIPVLLVHTIKLLAPLTTVVMYRAVFGKRYPLRTYLTLLPLVCGVMLTCLKPSIHDGPGFHTGLVYAFVLMLVFVLQNMFAKNILTPAQTPALPVLEKSTAERLHNPVLDLLNRKLDKLTILFACLLVGFALTFPIWLCAEYRLATLLLTLLTTGVLTTMVANGVAHFVQLLLAFHLLGMITPVNYSIANICKRIVVILVAVCIEGKKVQPVQGVGLALTMTGLYAYDRWGSR